MNQKSGETAEPAGEEEEFRWNSAEEQNMVCVKERSEGRKEGRKGGREGKGREGKGRERPSKGLAGTALARTTFVRQLHQACGSKNHGTLIQCGTPGL